MKYYLTALTMDNKRLQELLTAYKNKTCTDEQIQELEHWYQTLNLDSKAEVIDDIDAFSTEMLARFREKIAPKKLVIPFYRNFYFRVAAASILIVFTLGIYLQYKDSSGEMAKNKVIAGIKQDIAPGGNKAVLTLADGSIIVLDSAANGDLVSQGNTKIIKLNAVLDYQTTGATTEVLYNTITTPKGGKYQLVLSDGTKVWLNAASSLRFPTAFIGEERRVELNGEGYFEVAKHAGQPFKVLVAGKSEVKVLGTHFNINSYSDEPTINTTLLEGAVLVSAGNLQQKLIPGQQAQLLANHEMRLNNSPDIEEVMAWKNGKFDFGESTDIATIMRQISRWYDVDFEIQGNISDHIGGAISRDVSISKIFQMLELTRTVHFNLEGKKVIVTPYKNKY